MSYTVKDKVFENNRRKKISETMKRKGIKPVPHKSWNKGLTKETDERIKNCSLNTGMIRKGKTYEEFYGIEIANKLKEKRKLKMLGHKVSEETRKKLGLVHKGKKILKIWNKGLELPKEIYPNFGLRTTRKNIIMPIKDSKIEIRIQNFLKELSIDFFTHQYIKEIKHGYQCDILIPSMNLIIECDGDYWHKYPTGRNIDYIRTSELLSKGFKVLRLWEREIKVMDLNKFEEKLINIRSLI